MVALAMCALVGACGDASLEPSVRGLLVSAAEHVADAIAGQLAPQTGPRELDHDGACVSAAIAQHELQHTAQAVLLLDTFLPGWQLERSAFRGEARFERELLAHPSLYGLDRPDREVERATLEFMLHEADATSDEQGARRYVAEHAAPSPPRLASVDSR